MNTEGQGTTGNAAERLVDDYSGFKVYDERGEKLGKVEYTILDHDEQPQYLGVNTGFFGTKTTLIPEEMVRLDDNDRSFSVQTSADRVKEARTFDHAEDITPEYESGIREHYGLGTKSSQTPGGESRGDQHGVQSGTGSYDHGHSDDEYRESSEDRHDLGHDEQSGHFRDERHDTSREQTRDDSHTERSEDSSSSGILSSSSSSDVRRETETETRETRDIEDRNEGFGRDTAGGEREQIRVTLKHEEARAERVIGADGEEEVRIRKTIVREEKLIDVEDAK